MHAPGKALALAAVGATAFSLMPVPHVAAGGGTFQATGRPEVTHVFLGPEGPTRFTDRVKAKFTIKIAGARTKVITLRRPGGIATATFTLQPGDSFPWHVHPGPVIVSVVGGGELTYLRGRDCLRRPYAAGAVFIEPGPELHTAFNQGTEPVTLVGTFFDVPPGEALSTPAHPAKQLRLDTRCDISTVLP